MQILQNDIFGKKHGVVPADKGKKTSLVVAPKPFNEVTISDGIDEGRATSESMLIHRALQKKLIYAGFSTEKQKEVFLRILENEMNIKSGKIDPATASRDSLLAFFGR